jgi:hypothetical protein
MQFVYLCRKGPNEELRYSIRSVVKNFPDAKILVVGEPPSWYVGDILLVKQNSTKYVNVSNNLRQIALSDLVEDTFIMMNDDFYFLSNEYGYYYEGTLQEKHDTYRDINGPSSYNKKILDTINRLKKMGYPDPLSYELHIPFPVEKAKLSKIVRHNNVLWRSIYGNVFNVGGHITTDVKVYAKDRMSFKAYDYKTGSSPFLSTNDASFKEVEKNLLMRRFKKKTVYEQY